MDLYLPRQLTLTPTLLARLSRSNVGPGFRRYELSSALAGAWTLTFYPSGNPIEAAAHKVASSFNVKDVTLWPTEEANIYRATWFNQDTYTCHEEHLRVYPH